MKKHLTLNGLMQVGLLAFTTSGFILTSLKLPQYGLVLNLLAQVFWIYSSYRAWKKARQVGIFINTILITAVLLYGVINYWFI